MDDLNYFKLDSSTVAVAFITFILTSIMLRKRNKPYKLPPGPIRLPFIGTVYYNILRIDRCADINKRFGPISTHYVGNRRFIILTSFEAMSEIGHLSTCSDRGRCDSFIAQSLNPSLKGFFYQDYSDRYKLQRNRCMSILKNLGMGKQAMESIIGEELDKLTTTFVDMNEKEFDPWYMVASAVTNVLFSVLMSERFDHADPSYLDFIKQFEEGFSQNKLSRFVDSISFLRFVSPFKEAYVKVVAGAANTTQYLWKYAANHFETFRDNTEGDFIDRWCNKNAQKLIFDAEDLRRMLFDLYIAGSETTATSLKWTLIQLANRPDIQRKLHEEIDTVVGADRPISLQDRERLPYLNAFIWEIQRFFTVVPFSVSHCSRCDLKVDEYDIPAKTAILFNLHGMHMNEESFGDPGVFRPERYLNEEGKFVKHPHVNPFGIGKRLCLGEMLAKQELFLFTAGLVQKFNFKPPVDSNEIDDKGIFSFTYFPKRFKIRAIPRNV